MLSRRVRGFSLIEVVVSSGIVATSVGALFTVAAMSVRLTLQGQDRLIASQLAREGLEIVRQVRDIGFVSGDCSATVTCDAWHSGLFSIPNNLPPFGVRVDSEPTRGFQVTRDDLGSKPCSDYIFRNLVTGQMGMFHTPPNGPDLQIFCRRIYLEPVHLPHNTEDETQNWNAIRVRSQVAWTGYGKNSLLTPGNPTSTSDNSCARPVANNSFQEWCTEQVMILTNWRVKQ